jgi:DNA replication protein DnaC
MLKQPTLEKLESLKLTGMLKAYTEQVQMPGGEALSFDERFGLLLDREACERDNRRLTYRLQKAKLRLSACIEDIDYRHPRGLDKSVMLQLAGCQWIRTHDNCIITGATGAGKTYIACALGQKACREGFSVLYRRLPRLFEELAVSRGDGRYPRMLAAFARADLMILDDWGTAPLTSEQRRDIFEIFEDRYDRRSTLVAAQLPVKHWHETIGDPTLADAILDRLIHNAHKISLKGESMRRKEKQLTNRQGKGR